MSFKTWFKSKIESIKTRFKRNAKRIGYVSATIALVLTFAKESSEDARRTVDKIDALNSTFEDNAKVKESQELREEFDSKIGKASTTSAEMIIRLTMSNRNTQLAWSELAGLAKESHVIGQTLDEAKLQDLMKVCDDVQDIYEQILRLFNGDTSKFPDDKAVVNQVHELVLKFIKKNKTVRDDLPKLFQEVQAHVQEAYTNANEELLLWKVAGRILQVLSYIVTVAALAAGVKPAEGSAE
jgi:hypothetical protein